MNFNGDKLTLRSQALAGYVDAPGGEVFPFAIYLTDVPLSGINDVIKADSLIGQMVARQEGDVVQLSPFPGKLDVHASEMIEDTRCILANPAVSFTGSLTLPSCLIATVGLPLSDPHAQEGDVATEHHRNDLGQHPCHDSVY